MTPSPSHSDRPAALRLRGLLHDAREVGSERGRGLVAALLGNRRVTREVEEGDRRRPLRLLRPDPTLVHELLGHSDQVLEHGVLPVPPLEPERRGPGRARCTRPHAGRPWRPSPHWGARRRRPSAEPRGRRTEPGADEPLNRPAVEPREARELVVVGEVERGDDELQHLGVLVPQPVVLRGGNPSSPPSLLRSAGSRPSSAASFA